MSCGMYQNALIKRNIQELNSLPLPLRDIARIKREVGMRFGKDMLERSAVISYSATREG